jgi:hypothetical protein
MDKFELRSAINAVPCEVDWKGLASVVHYATRYSTGYVFKGSIPAGSKAWGFEKVWNRAAMGF